jgi:hypothetical protein
MVPLSHRARRCTAVVAIHHTQSIDRILIKIGAESEASYGGPEEKMLQRCGALPT